ncbi:MAG: alpha-L-rhamnosidase [Paenibacillus sp.]|nr:alpha-L-rhamnosidase [Paenibacillus sp.]
MTQPLQVMDLRCEYKHNPLGTDVMQPRISWKIEASKRDVAQSAYRIQAATDASFATSIVWDTGKHASDQSLHIEYGGTTLQSRTRYYYRVQAWDQNDSASDWSETAFWETALFNPSEWTAEWITANLPREEGDPEPNHQLRRTFTIQGELVSARIYATSLGLYKLYVNGADADDALFTPGWTSYNKRLQYQTYDVTSLLKEGINALGVQLANGWYKGNLGWAYQTDIYGKDRAALLQLHLTYADGRSEIVATDSSWSAAAGPILMSEIYHGETYDARLETDGWLLASYEETSDWSKAVTLEHSKEILIAQENMPVRAIQEIKPIRTLTTPIGETVVDLGQNMVGWVRFSVEAPAGTVITIQHAEVLDKEGNFYTGNLRKAKQLITYICRGGAVEIYEPTFTFQGFRYVKIEGLANNESIASSLVGVVIHTDLEETGTFHSSNELLNQLQRNIVWGQKGNFLDVPTDCPQRDERLGWTGDAQVFIRTSAFIMNVAPFFSKWLRDLEADQLPNGGVPYVIPQVLDEKSHSSAAWGDAAVICPWTLYECYGDTRILEVQYNSMKAWIDYMHAQGDDEFLWNTGFHFGDWLGLDAKEDSYIGATPKDLIATAYFAYSTHLFAKIAAILNRQDDAAVYSELHRNVVDHFRKEFVTPNGRLAAPTQTAHALALTFDLLEEKDRKRAADTLAAYITENKDKLTTGFVGTPYLCHALTRYGHIDVAFKLVLQEEYPSWLYSVLQGATTIWEHWDGIKPDGSFWSDNMNSFNHYAYGSVGDWLYRTVAGIDTDDQRTGYKRIHIRPNLTPALTHAKASYQSMYGEISAGWDTRTEGSISISITIPANTDAAVYLPGAKLSSVRENGSELHHAAGVRQFTQTEQGVALELGSGQYNFTYSA